MKIKKNLIILILLSITITLSLLNLKNTSKINLYFLNFKTEKLTLGSVITIAFLAGFTTTFTFSYLSSYKNENKILDEEKIDLNSETSQDDFIGNNSNLNESIQERPPERDIRESQPTISVNYRVIRQNNTEVNDLDEGYSDNKYQNYDDWDEIESNW